LTAAVVVVKDPYLEYWDVKYRYSGGKARRVGRGSTG